MINKRKFSKIILPAVLILMLGSCTKLNQDLGSTLSAQETTDALGSAGVGLLLQGAYTGLGGPFTAQDLVFGLEENSTDEALVPTRGGDWDDNGVWRVLHNHTWNADHTYVLNVFNALNKAQFDATNVLNFNPSIAQAAEARFIRAYTLYYLLDLYGQYPFRDPGANLLEAPEVKAGAAGADFIISELEEILPNLPASNGSNLANPDACRTLLMKCYLQRGAWITPASPTFDAANLDKVIALGNVIINSGKYSLTPNYFDNFAPNNATASKETIFRHENLGGVAAGNSGMQARWNMTLHYNSYTPNNPNAGWNGFSTISDFYNSFGAVTGTAESNRVGGAFTGVGAKNNSDTAIDTRLGGRYTLSPYSVANSGIRPGFLIGQQYNEKGEATKDRKGNPLAYDPKIADNQIETGSNLEVTGIRVVKYTPDYDHYGNQAENDLIFFRYADVMLMVAEAMMRKGDNAGGLSIVNTLRTARGAATFATLPIVNPNNVDDPNTLLAERGRELYWETMRRTDLIRFGVFNKPWGLKPTDDPKYLWYPIPSQSLSVNPNLVQNPGY